MSAGPSAGVETLTASRALGRGGACRQPLSLCQPSQLINSLLCSVPKENTLVAVQRVSKTKMCFAHLIIENTSLCKASLVLCGARRDAVTGL